jgi:hypothetical protein
MRLFYFLKYWKFFIIIVAIISTVFIFEIVRDSMKLPEGSIRRFNRQYEPYEVGPLKIGSKMPWAPGDSTLAPYLTIPLLQKFYISVAEPDNWCANENCGIDGGFIQTMGGWLQVENTHQSEVGPSFGLDLPEHNNIKSIVIVGDRKGRIVGIYPNKDLKDVLNILKNHPDLANFGLLSGVTEFGKLKSGHLAPLKPGDPISSGELEKFSVDTIPKNKKFYLYALQKRKYDVVGMREKQKNEYDCFLGAGCRYPEPDPQHDFLFDTIDRLNGWFLANDMKNTELIKLFGLDPDDVLSGKTSLVVLTDARGIIVGLHPQKTLSDAVTILSQHPGLADVQKLYKQK